MFKDKRILITGGTGSWGYELTSQLIAKDPDEIIIFARNELSQVQMLEKFGSDICDFVIGDVRDYDAIFHATKGIDYVFHLAALKHVPICERLPHEAIKTNITGTTNVIKAAIENMKVSNPSTDVQWVNRDNNRGADKLSNLRN